MIVQNKYRADVLIRDNSIDERNIFIVPNSYHFATRKCRDHAIDNLQILNDKKIIIYTGSLIPEMAIEDIIQYIDFWPQDTIFLIHTPHRTAYLENIELFIKRNRIEQKVVISSTRLSFEDLCMLISKANISISFCKPIDKNYELTPSGKISFYLSQGIPIIVNNVPTSMDLISKYKCGVCVDTPEKVGKEITTILENYSEFSINAKKCFNEKIFF